MKKIISVFAAIAIMLAALCPAVFAADPAVRYGDANGDGKINARDVVAIMKYLVGYDVEINLHAADIAGDSYDWDGETHWQISAKDVVMLMRYISGEDIILGKTAKRFTVPDKSFFEGKTYGKKLWNAVESAKLIKDGKETVISPDDERLKLFFNMVQYAKNNYSFEYPELAIGSWSQGEAFKEAILDIVFKDDSEITDYVGSIYYNSREYTVKEIIVGKFNCIYEFTDTVVNDPLEDDAPYTVHRAYWVYLDPESDYEPFGEMTMLEWCGF